MAEDIVQKTDGMIPMICQVSREQLLMAVNRCFREGHKIPMNAEISVKGGTGDWPEPVEIEISGNITIDIRWKQRDYP